MPLTAEEILCVVFSPTAAASLLASHPTLVDAPRTTLSLLATRFSGDTEGMAAYLEAHSGRVCLEDLFSASWRRWETFCDQAERRERGLDVEAGRHMSVFGTCRRCGSTRLLVTTQQLRRGDEGMTELRHCRDCGHMSRINS